MQRRRSNWNRIGLLFCTLFLIPRGLLAQEAAEFEVGSRPVRMIFDGENIWVGHVRSNTVKKLRARDGETLGTYAVGDRPRSQIVFDGTYIWFTNSGDGTVTKLRASDGTLVDTLKVGEGPRAIAYDGSAVWVGNTDSDNVTRLDAE